MGDNGLSIADAMAIARGNNCGSHAEGGSWGSDWVLFLFFLMAWGGGGAFGFGGDRGFGVNAPALQGTLTRADLTEGFNNQAVLSKLDALTGGQCDSTYALNNAITGGFAGISAQLNGMAAQNASCCCDIRAAVNDVKYANERGNCDIITAIKEMGQRIIDNQTQSEMTSLRNELQSAQLQLSNNAQTTNLIAALRPFPQPAYITCSPYTSNGTPCGCYA